MLIVAENALLSETYSTGVFLARWMPDFPPVTKKKKKKKGLRFQSDPFYPLFFSKDAMLCFNLRRKGDERQCNKAKRSFCSYQMAFHS